MPGIGGGGRQLFGVLALTGRWSDKASDGLAPRGDIPVGISCLLGSRWYHRRSRVILAISWGMASSMSPIAEELKAIPEVQKVCDEGYEIWFYRSQPNTRYQQWFLEARKHGRGKAHLSADFIAAKQCLYIANVCVDQATATKDWPQPCCSAPRG